MAVSSAGGSTMVRPATSNQVPVVGDEAFPQARMAAQFGSLRATRARAIGMTSTGSGNRPRVATCLEASAMHKAPGHGGDGFPGSARRRAFDHVQRPVDLVGTVDVDRDVFDRIRSRTGTPWSSSRRRSLPNWLPRRGSDS